MGFLVIFKVQHQAAFRIVPMSFNLLHSLYLPLCLTSHVTPYMSSVCLSTYPCVPLHAHYVFLHVPLYTPCTPMEVLFCVPPMCSLCANIFTPTYPLHAPTFPSMPPFVPLHVPTRFSNVPYMSPCVFYVPSCISTAGPLTCPSVCPSDLIGETFYHH